MCAFSGCLSWMLLVAAVDAFQQSVKDNDTLSQSAFYYIGEASIKLDDKQDARSAFRSAYKHLFLSCLF